MVFLLSGGVFGFVAHRRDLLKIDLLPQKEVRVRNAAIPTPIKSGFLFRAVIVKIVDTSSFLP